MGLYGISAAANAISQAVTDTFKGLNEGVDERRKEEEAARKRRAEEMQMTMFPHELKYAQLRNQQMGQAMDLAQTEEGRRARAFVPEQRTREAGAITAEADAGQAYKRAQLAVDQAEANLKTANQRLKEDAITFPFLKPRLEEEQKLRQIEYNQRKYALDELEKARAAQSRISIKLLGAGLDFNKIVAALADPDARYLRPDDSFLQILEMYFRAQNANARNPFEEWKNRMMVTNQAEDDARVQADKLLTSAFSPSDIKLGIIPGIATSRAWLQQYVKARRLIDAELRLGGAGVKFSDQEKAIEAMPPELIEGLAENSPVTSDILNTPMGKHYSRQVYQRMNAYLTQGWEWSRAANQARTDHFTALSGTPTASDQYVTRGERGWQDSTGKEILGDILTLNIKPKWLGSTKPSTTPLPPKVTDPRRTGAPDLRTQRLNELIAKDAEMQSVGITSIEDLKQKLKPERAKEFIDYFNKLYRQTYGTD